MTTEPPGSTGHEEWATVRAAAAGDRAAWDVLWGQRRRALPQGGPTALRPEAPGPGRCRRCPPGGMDRSPGPAGRLCGERPAHAAPALAALPGGAAAADRPPPPFHAGARPAARTADRTRGGSRSQLGGPGLGAGLQRHPAERGGSGGSESGGSKRPWSSSTPSTGRSWHSATSSNSPTSSAPGARPHRIGGVPPLPAGIGTAEARIDGRPRAPGRGES